MQKLSTVCKCGHRAINHTPAIEDGCDICACKKFAAETDIEKLRALFYGDHNFSHDYEHDAKLYAAALEHKYAQAIAIAQININAGAECKKELETARAEVKEREYINIQHENDKEKLREQLEQADQEINRHARSAGKAIARGVEAERERDAAQNEIKRRCERAKICGCDPCHESICPLHAYRRRGGILDKFAMPNADNDTPTTEGDDVD